MRVRPVNTNSKLNGPNGDVAFTSNVCGSLLVNDMDANSKGSTPPVPDLTGVTIRLEWSGTAPGVYVHTLTRLKISTGPGEQVTVLCVVPAKVKTLFVIVAEYCQRSLFDSAYDTVIDVSPNDGAVIVKVSVSAVVKLRFRTDRVAVPPVAVGVTVRAARNGRFVTVTLQAHCWFQ